MRIAILSDIHSNLEALQKAIEIIKQKNIDKVVCLGDTVGYGANPNECINLIRSITGHIILGNHDTTAVHLNNLSEFNIYARKAIIWTHDTLTQENKDFIQTLPYSIELDNLFFVHASPYEPNAWHYIFSRFDIENNFDYFHQLICFFGHTHLPGIYCQDLNIKEFTKEHRFLINVGSVGQPRDLNRKLSFGIFDTENWTYENIRAEYDVITASNKIKNAGLPQTLAERILVGK